MVPHEEVYVEVFEEFESLGKFVLRDMGKTIGVGYVKSIEQEL